MGNSNPNLSESKNRNSVLNHIINCASSALHSTEDFLNAMLALAAELRVVFNSEYCSIGTVEDGFAQDCIISYKRFEDEKLSKQQEISLESVKRVSIDDNRYTVCQALKSNENISWYKQEEMDGYGNYARYKEDILQSGFVKDSCVIPIRDNNNLSFGFIQFINTINQIDYDQDILPFKDALLGLVQIIINSRKNKREILKQENLLKDADFYSIMQNKKDNINALLDSIMEYFSDEFNASVISFRIPLLNGYYKDPIFYLRRMFVHQSIGSSKRQELINRYIRERLVKHINDMTLADQLRCDHQGKILESVSNSDFLEYGLDLDSNTLIMPIFSDLDNKCIYSMQGKDKYCTACNNRLKRLYGIFRLRISKTDLFKYDTNFHHDREETKARLEYLSKQITLLLNSIFDRHENESLMIFQNELKNSSFIKIKDFDKRCVDIIRQSVHAKICSIYRYDDRSKYLSLSATTAKTILFRANDNNLYFEPEKIKDSCFIHAATSNNVLTQAFKTKSSIYVFNIKDVQIHQSPFIEFTKEIKEPAMAIPMIKKDGACAGVVLLLGKEQHIHSISTAYWEHDIKYNELIVNILTRISESDTERLTFLSQLAHEMLAPVTELVYDNDLTVNVAERNPDSYTRRHLISKLRENIDRNMLFKYIISDTEFIYSTSGKSIEYNIVKQEKPQTILLDAIRLMEKDAHAKGLSITTHIRQMPILFFDKERMMQVFINLLKNAIRYSDPNTTINVSYDKGKNDFHEICFANVGIGVREDEKEVIFELFHRGEAARKRFTRGTGMGLYIIRDIMKAHGGDCYVKKTENPTEFVITLPNK